MKTIRLPGGEWQFSEEQPLGPPGGFGEVFAGVGPDGVAVAVKRLSLTAEEAAHRELEIAGRLLTRALAHVVPVLDAGRDAESDRYFVVMARAQRSLQKEIDERGRLPLAEASSVLAQIADGLIEASDIVHRDLKPSNVLLHDGVWKIADFGVARFVEESTSTATLRNHLSPPYAAPEQWRLEHATSATDVYALGCIAHALLVGRPPFAGPDTAHLREQHLNVVPPTLVTDDARVSSLVSDMLRKLPAARPSLTRVAAVLRSVLTTPAPKVRAVVAGLQRAAATETQLRMRREVEAETARAKTEERQRLAEAGASSFDQLCNHLAHVVREADESIHVAQSSRYLEVSVGVARLGMRLFDSYALVPADLPYSKWVLLLRGAIQVDQPAPHDEWSHSATLWYMQLPNQTDYRWYEVSYKDNALVGGQLRGPYGIENLRDADLAAGPGMHSVEISFGPVPIDSEDVDAFAERWLERLVAAYNGRLRPF